MEEKIEFEKLFRESQGEPIVVRGKTLVALDRFQMPSKEMTLSFSFIETNSEWKQGFILKTKGTFDVADSKIKNSVVFWEDTAPENVHVKVNSKDRELLIYNVWDTGNGVTQAWHNGAAMEIKASESKHIYNCNDGHPDFDFNDLIFSMEW